ncbi:hypothetical protein [Pseudohongiella nitratireducens]|uniref:hypothetical protein n=1 Tax=Pseudohongiella nitratireducens TaxID=1768907 RepID=UPI0030EF8800|tara:strand:+ start:3133 stop:4092 length:960 start_codon:yes stop_codon:yes gene_type:complete
MKLLELRKWLRISEAAQYLSLHFREEVNDSDILQFVLNRHLVLSVYLFDPVVALKTKIDPDTATLVDQDDFEFLPGTKTLRGLVDLLPVHGGIDAIESIYREHLGGAPTRLRPTSGLLVCTEDRSVYQIQESLARKQQRKWEEEKKLPRTDEKASDDTESYEKVRSKAMFCRRASKENNIELEPRVRLDSMTPHWLRSLRLSFRPAIELPQGCLSCISMNNLKKFVMENSSPEDKSQKDTLGDLERSSLLKLVLGMAISKYGYQPGASRNIATGGNRGSISSDLERLGFSLDSETVRKFINEACTRFDVKLPSEENDLS